MSSGRKKGVPRVEVQVVAIANKEGIAHQLSAPHSRFAPTHAKNKHRCFAVKDAQGWIVQDGELHSAQASLQFWVATWPPSRHPPSDLGRLCGRNGHRDLDRRTRSRSVRFERTHKCFRDALQMHA